MKKDVLNKSMVVAAGILFAGSLAFAKFPSFDLGHSSKQSARVAIDQTARIPGGPTLQSGEYKVVLNNNSRAPEMEFYQNGKLIAQVPAKLIDQGKKIDETKIYYDTRSDNTEVITQIDLSGWREKILFSKNRGEVRSAK